MTNCISCGAPCTTEDSQRLSFTCNYCGTFNLLGQRKAPNYNDNSLRALIDETVRLLIRVKSRQTPLSGGSWYSRFSSVADEYAEKYLYEWISAVHGGESEREQPMCTVSDTFIEAIGYYEFIRVVLILFRAYDVKEMSFDNNIAREWVQLASAGKKISSDWRVYPDHYKLLMDKIHFSKYRGLSDMETYKILTSIVNIATQYLDSIHLYLFDSLKSSIGYSKLQYDSIYRMAGIEMNNRFYFISLLIPASEQNTDEVKEQTELKGLAKSLASDSVLLTFIKHISYNELKYYIAQSSNNYIEYVCDRDPKEKRVLSFLDKLGVLIPVPSYYDIDKAKNGSGAKKKTVPTAYWIIVNIPVWILIGFNQHWLALIVVILAWLLSRLWCI